MRFVGVDLSKKNFTAVFLNEDGTMATEEKYAMDQEGLGSFRKDLTADDEVPI